ncbi:MAG: FtsX-like permease family protein [Spirochaetaceae bacterium]|jgi:lipoprotein-releasing system permease protein|nr:FtsX-like permease family protein [Spirochaetaceae bacterium]
MNSSFFIALRYLWGRAGEGGRYLRGAAASIALSLVPIIVTLIVADGMIRGITDRYLELGTGHLEVYDYIGAGEFPQDVQNTVLAVEGIRGAWRERQGLGIILGRGGRTGATVRAVEAGFWEDPGSSAFLKVEAGTAVLESDRELLLGRGLAETLGAEPGSQVRLMTVRNSGENQNLPRVTLFTVKGIISSGYRELDSLWCIMSYQAGLELLSPELYRSFLTVKIEDPYGRIAQTADRVRFKAGPGYAVYTWMELQQSLYRSFESTRQMLLFIMALLVLVAAVNVSSATSMLVIERQRDIAILKTGGGSPVFIRKVFLWGSFLTGLSGALLGGALGLCLGRFINPIIRGLEGILQFFTSPWGGQVKILDPEYYLEEIPVIIDWGMILLIGIFTLAASILASIPPARRAGKLKPLEILRRI